MNPNGTQTLTINVNQAPAVTTNPSDQSVNPGASVSFTAAASGFPTPTVQWQRSTDGGGELHQHRRCDQPDLHLHGGGR